jgi:hypothetical protein
MTPTFWLRVTGVLTAILFLVSLAFLGELLGAFGDPDHVFIDYYDDSGNRPAGLIGGIGLFKAALIFLVFTEVLLIPGRETRSPLASYIRGLSILFAGLVVAAAAALATVDYSRFFADIFEETEIPFEGSTVAVLPQLGYVLLLAGGGWTAAVIVALVSYLGKTAATLPAPVAYSGFVIAVLLLLSPAVMPFLLFPLWILLVTFTARLHHTEPAV